MTITGLVEMPVLEVVMRRFLTLVGLLAILLLAITPEARIAGGLTIGPPVSGESEEEEAEGAGGEQGPAGGDQWFIAQRAYPFATATAVESGYRAAADQAVRVRRTAAIGVNAAGPWQPLGPSNIGGRVTDMV